MKCRKQALGHLKPGGQEGLRKRAEELHQYVTHHLLCHFQAEEEVLFPAVRKCAPQCDALVESLLQDHREIRARVTQLADEGLLDKSLFDLGDLLERHIRREERELFPVFESEVGPTEAERVGKDMEKILGSRSS